MKLLVVIDQLENGGAGRVTATMCRELTNRGYNIELATDNINFAVNYRLPGNIIIHPVSFIGKDKRVISRFVALSRTIRELRKIIKSVKPDIILSIQGNGFIRSFIANRFSGIPNIAVDHTSFARKMDFINNFTRNYLYGFAEGLSILTKRDEKILGDKYPRKRVIYNPLPYPVLGDTTVREKSVLCVGRFDIWKIKGFDIILNIWRELFASFPEWELWFAGSGKSNSVDYMKSLVHQYGLDNNVKFLGQVIDMKSVYARAGIFALPSRTEGFPMALLEAMSQGCPCVAFNVGGASEEMIEEGAGFVITDGDCRAFKEALIELMSHVEMREAFSCKAVASVARFSVESFGDAWENLLKDTLRK